jgi:hypothetical protein
MNNQQRRSLVQLLLNIPDIESYMTRTTLLMGIPNTHSLSRDAGNPQNDINMLVSQLSNIFLNDTGVGALQILIENACSRVSGTTLDGELATLQQQLIAQHQRADTPPVSARPIPRPSSGPTPEDKDLITIFYSYAPEDAYYCRELEKQLVMLRRQKIVRSWHGLDMQAGATTPDETNRALQAADIVLLLVSPDFMNSDRLYEEQVLPALAQREAGTSIVIPIIVRDADGWKNSEFGKIFALPRTGKSIKASSNSDATFTSIAKDIRDVVERLREERK